MSWIVAILSVFLVLACLLLILLVLIQLPKKEAGMGQAFGGGATDALFGAGSGTALTKMTKYTTGIFFVLTMLLWVLKAQEGKQTGSNLEKTMQQLGKSEKAALPPVPTTPATGANTTSAPAPTLLTTSATSNALISGQTNGGTKPATNAGPATQAEKPK